MPGVFVFGSNDYYSPTLRNPLRYLLPDDGKRHIDSAQLPWRELRTLLEQAGWRDLTNRRDRLVVGDTTFAFAGVDDPHLRYDDLASVAGPADAAADVRVGVAHAPYLRVLDQFAADGYDAVLAGHTHGGQVCLPGSRARWSPTATSSPPGPRGCTGTRRASRPGDPGSAWLHVSAGPGHEPLRPDPGRLPAGGDPADAHAAAVLLTRSRALRADWGGPSRLGYARPCPRAGR